MTEEPKQDKQSKKWYDMMPWWAWIGSGFVLAAIQGDNPPAFIVILVPLTIIVGICVGFGKLVERDNRRN
jgi:hypothetical protein